MLSSRGRLLPGRGRGCGPAQLVPHHHRAAGPRVPVPAPRQLGGPGHDQRPGPSQVRGGRGAKYLDTAGTWTHPGPGPIRPAGSTMGHSCLLNGLLNPEMPRGTKHFPALSCRKIGESARRGPCGAPGGLAQSRSHVRLVEVGRARRPSWATWAENGGLPLTAFHASGGWAGGIARSAERQHSPMALGRWHVWGPSRGVSGRGAPGQVCTSERSLWLGFAEGTGRWKTGGTARGADSHQPAPVVCRQPL